MSKKIEDALTAEKAQSDAKFIPTGCTLLDLNVGGGVGMGWKAGTIVNLIGDKSAGKSFIKNETIAAAHYTYGKKLKRFSDDTESGDTFDTSALYGIDIHPSEQQIGKKVFTDSETVEELDAKVGTFLDHIADDEVGIYAVDSLDGLTDANKDEMEALRKKMLLDGKEVKDAGDYGTSIQKFLSQHFFRTKHSKLEKKNALLIIVSQIRDKLNAGMFEQKWNVSGGKALEFYSHTRLVLANVAKIKKGDRIVGAVIEAKTIKSKTPRPFRVCRFSFYFDYGVDNIGSNIDYLFDLRNDRGDLTPSLANYIPWDAKREMSYQSLKDWLEEIDMLEHCKEQKKLETGRSNLTQEWLESFVKTDEKLSAQYFAEFGRHYTRDELIAMCEEDRKLERELEQRVIAKWEAIEDSVKTGRKRKY